MYSNAKPKIVVLALNPGAGNSNQSNGNIALISLLQDFKNGKKTFDDVLAFQGQHMQAWGKTPGRFVNFYSNLTERPLNELAFLNVALCSTVQNSYPSVVLETCFKKHTSNLLMNLKPDIVLLSGSDVHKYAGQIPAVLPSARIEPVLHYAHREGIARDLQEYARVRELIARVSSASGA